MAPIRVPSRWGAGARWGPVDDDLTKAYWGPVAVPADRPNVFVSINGVLQPTLRSASWRSGSGGWFDELSPTTVSLGFTEAATGDIGDAVLVTTETRTLFRGVLESIANDKDQATGAYQGSVVANDGLGALGISEYTGIIGSASGYTLATLIPFVMRLIGMDPITIVEGDSATALPQLINALADAVPIRGKTLLEYIGIAERSSNAILTLQPDGTFVATTRDAILSPSVDVLDLVGSESPASWRVETLKSSVINHWVMTTAGGTVVLDETDADSVALYGENTYSISDYMDDDVDHFTTDMRTALATPRPQVTSATFPITSTEQAVLGLKPLDWVSFDGDTWQVMGVQHDVSPGAWAMSITADVSQNYMAGAAEPTPEDPDPTPATLDTQTATSTKSAVVVRSPSGQNLGNGAGDYLPCGYWKGFKHRPLIDFPTISKPSGFIRVRKATLTLRTTGQIWVGFGSKPRFYVRRLKKSFTEGTYTDAIGSQYGSGNACVWGEQTIESETQTLKIIGRTENNTITVDVTEQVQAAFDAGAFHGFALVSANESSKTNTIEFYSDDHGTSGWRPELKVVCEVA